MSAELNGNCATGGGTAGLQALYCSFPQGLHPPSGEHSQGERRFAVTRQCLTTRLETTKGALRPKDTSQTRVFWTQGVPKLRSDMGPTERPVHKEDAGR